MTTSPEPWSATGNNLVDFLGNIIATFKDERDLELVLEAVRNRVPDDLTAELQKQVAELEQELRDLEDDCDDWRKQYDESCELCEELEAKLAAMQPAQ
jgi:chromosome segregation ATPase